MWSGPAISSLATPAPLYVEASSLLDRRLTGIGRFVTRLVHALVQLRPVRLVTTIQAETAHSCGLSTALLCGQEIAIPAECVADIDTDVAAWARTVLRLPRRKHDLAASRRHAGLYTMLRPAQRHFARELCLLYDFTPSVLPWAHRPGTWESYGTLFTSTAALCDKAVAISESTRADARWLCALPAENIVVGYPGPSLCVHAHAEQKHVRRREDLILVVSTLEPRKNSRFLMEWFLETEVLNAAAELWWIGPTGWLSDGLSAARKHPSQRRVRFLGMVSDQRLCAAYRQAAFTIYPSLYEGFGFPVLDSLWHGTPVLCSYNSSLAEFTGPGLFHFDACDPSSLDAAYVAMEAARPITIDHEALREQYSWDALAQKVIGLCA
ncbi:MAG TPA: glycosyltransferase family 1 protein [Gemmataceae bacterium]|jgi:glycosyltransferase involved in cell wall biosynthesis|nr:glycosyltransferase family 1 protein [Gemmataceae bacterium]